MTSYAPHELVVHAVLQDWFDALQNGSAHYRLPDANYQRPQGKPPWTDEDLDRLMKEIDNYVWEQRSWAEHQHHATYDAGPAYARLRPPQRLAFAQDLERALNAPLAREPLEPATEDYSFI